MRSIRLLVGWIPVLVIASAGSAGAVTCDLPDTVGGGTSNVSPSPGAGWDVGGGQCNGDFTAVRDLTFPGDPGGDGIELGMRAEQRRVGQINPPAHAGSDYTVQTGEDPGTGGTRAWWNFQQSIAYDGVIDDLDFLTFAIRTDAGSSVPVGPADMLAIRPSIDARNTPPNPTATFSELYQTSQNPVFGWFSSYDMNEEGAWTLTLAAGEAGRFAHVSICIHTPAESCAPEPAVYTCAGASDGKFAPPMNKVVKAKRRGRVLPLKMICRDDLDDELTDVDIAPPILRVTKTSPAGDVTDDGEEFLYAGLGQNGNEFVFQGDHWQFNLQTKNFDGPGIYEITAAAGNGDLLVNPPIATFVID